MLRRTKFAVAMAALAVVVSGCSASEVAPDDAAQPVDAGTSPSQELIEAAQTEGSLVWYTSFPLDPSERAAAAFTDEFGVDVEVVRLNSDVFHPRYEAERTAGQSVADVIMETLNGQFSTYVDNGWLAPVDATSMSSVADWPEEYLFEDTFALINIQPIGIAYNTDLVDEADLESWESILDPKYKGEIVVADPGAVLAWTELFRVLQGEYGDEFLTDFSESDYQLQPSAVPGTQQVAAGEGMIAFPSLFSVANPLKLQGAPIDMKFFSPTTGVQQFIALTEGSPSPNAGKLFMNYLMSVDGQSALNEGVGASVLPDVPGTVELPEDYVLPNLDDALTQKASILGLLGL